MTDELPEQQQTVGQDDVDRIAAAWAQQRPDLDLTPLQVLSRVSRLSHHLDSARRRAFSDHGLATWEFDVLAALRRAGPPFTLTPGALLAQTLVTSGTMTNRVDRLERRGLVERRPGPRDGRSVAVVLTPAGQQRVDEAFADLLAFEHVVIAALSPSDTTQLAAGLRVLLSRFEEREL
ncbi:MAG: MarR family winged helix-turn-helix transcriptional regulator [Candidatus Nanopelagicales bacterium]